MKNNESRNHIDAPKIWKPKFSVVIPCFNEGKGLIELIERCQFVAQLGDGEFILVNNGSSDNTSSIFEKSIEANTSLRFVEIEKNIGYGNGILVGLEHASSEIVGWTHADLQCDPNDVLRALDFFESPNQKLFVQGKRFGRPIIDRLFTLGMSIFESSLTQKILRDINAQPTLFNRELMSNWENAPQDFSLDLFAFIYAKKFEFAVLRLPVIFAARKHGRSTWNIDAKAKWKFIKRTFAYSIQLRRNF